MKYINDLINEAKEVTARFEESKDLILCCYSDNKLNEAINSTVLLKYNSVIDAVNGLRSLLSDVREYETKSKLFRFYEQKEKRK